MKRSGQDVGDSGRTGGTGGGERGTKLQRFLRAAEVSRGGTEDVVKG